MHVAMIRRNGLGDLLCTVPLIKLCKEKFEGCQVTLVVDERGAPLVPYLEGVDEVVVIPQGVNKYFGLGQTAWRLRKNRFDYVISARPTPMKLLNIFAFLLGGIKRVAYVDGAWHSKFINAPRVYEAGDKRHQMVKTLRLLDPGLEEVPLHLLPRIKVKPQFQFEKRVVMVSVTNRRVGSQLDADKTQEILNRLAVKYDFEVVVNGEPQNVAQAEALARGLVMKKCVKLTAGFDEFLGLVASIDGFFIGDGGIMHLVAAMGKPQVVLFGGTQMWEWAPLSEVATCLHHPHNVNFISEDEMYQAVERLVR